jgi:hypothetical protein
MPLSIIPDILGLCFAMDKIPFQPRHETVEINCDEGMVVALLRNWRSNRLRREGIRLAVLRPQLIKKGDGVCPLCSTAESPKPLTNDGKATHIDHIKTVKEFAVDILHGKMQFDDAYCQMWADSNLRAICSPCNYARRKKGRI